MRGEAVGERGVDSPKIVPPAGASASAIRHGGKELLIPAHCAEELRRELVFSLKIVGEGIGITHARNLETDFVKLGPQLQMMQGVADVLAEKEFAIIANAASYRQRRGSFRAKIGTVARGDTEIPRLVRPKADAPANGWMVEANLGRVPRFWSRRPAQNF